ncbi:MAG: S8 family serine peptidase [Actinomycetota bacterium]|nr:S8 family serine peptidase [Actinomycetota bacterium]
MRSRLRCAALVVLVVASGALPPSIARSTPSSRIDTSFRSRLTDRPSEISDAIVSIDAVTPANLVSLAHAGLRVMRVFDAFGVVYVTGRNAAILRAVSLRGVTRISENAKLRFFGDTDTIATRARDAWDAKSTSTTPAKAGGVVVNGTGVGVAVVDSGIDTENPDLLPAMIGNKKYICTTPVLADPGTGSCYANRLIDNSRGHPVTGCHNDFWVDAKNTDTNSGHGTHVAGIVAGRGVASDLRYTGAAPGARLMGLGVGELNSVLSALEAFNWVHCNYSVVSPKIRVVNNSWGVEGGSDFIADDPIVKATNTLVADSIVVVFAVGNDGSGGSDTNTISGPAKNPKPGVVSVANYDDAGMATRTGVIDPTSSRGALDDGLKSDWPDVAAPGVNIISTGARTGAYIPTGGKQSYEPYYTIASGTSMSAPHVAGIVAELFQAKGTLTPAAVEDILEDTAAKIDSAGAYVPDSTNGTTPVNFAAGHGLVNAVSALHDARVAATGGSVLPQVSQDPHVFVGSDVQFVSGVQWTVPRAAQITLTERGIRSGNTTTFPLVSQQPAMFLVIKVNGSSLVHRDSKLSTDAASGGFSMTGQYTFSSEGTYRIEAQIAFGGVFRSFDSFLIRVE